VATHGVTAAVALLHLKECEAHLHRTCIEWRVAARVEHSDMMANLKKRQLGDPGGRLTQKGAPFAEKRWFHSINVLCVCVYVTFWQRSGCFADRVASRSVIVQHNNGHSMDISSLVGGTSGLDETGGAVRCS